MRVAALDQGTNTTRLLVADVAEGRVDEVLRRSQITRLGEGVDRRRRLLPLPIARVRNVLTDYRRSLEQLGAERALLVATSAVRDAENGDAFLGEIEWSYGFTTRLVAGPEEAELSFRGATLGRTLSAPTLVIDIGGGSTELVLGDHAGIRAATSIDAGSVRDDRALPARRPVQRAGVGRMRDRGALAAPRARPGRTGAHRGDRRVRDDHHAGRARPRPRRVRPERVDGHVLTADAVSKQLERLAGLPLEERRRVPALDPDRAPVIVAGTVILREVLDHYGLDTLEVSERDILDGIALEAAQLPEPVEGDAPPGAYTCC